MHLKAIFWLMTMALLWGPAFLFIKVAVQEIPPLTLAAARVSLAAILLYLILRLQGQNLPSPGPIWRRFFLSGLLLNALPYSLVFWGQQHIESALAAILIGAYPLFTIILAHFVTAEDRLTPAKGVGALVGFCGLVMLVAPTLLTGVRAAGWGLAATLGAAISYAGGTIYTQQKLRGLPPLVGPTGQLAGAAGGMIIVSFLVEPPATITLPSGQAIGALLALVIVSTVLSFIVYYRAMEQLDATTLSMVAYLIPLVGLALGVLVLGERLAWPAYAGSGLILAGVMIVNGVFRARPGLNFFRRSLEGVKKPTVP